MVIDYRPLLSKEGENRNNNMIVAYGDAYLPYNDSSNFHADIAFLHQGNETLEVCMPFDIKPYETTEKAPGLKGLFGKTVKQVHFTRGASKVGVVAQKVNPDNGVCMLQDKTGDCPSAKIVIDSKTGMAKLRRQPTGIGDILALLSVDPRYIAQIDVSLISPAERETVAIHVSRGLEKVLKSQSKLGVPYNEREHSQREAFTKEVAECYATFEARWQAEHGNFKSSEEESQS